MIPTQKQIDEFNTFGVVAIPDVLSESQLNTMGEAVDLAVASRSAGDIRSLDEMSIYEQSFTQCINLWETDKAVRKFTFNSDLAELSAALLGAKKLEFGMTRRYIKSLAGAELTPTRIFLSGRSRDKIM